MEQLKKELHGLEKCMEPEHLTFAREYATGATPVEALETAGLASVDRNNSQTAEFLLRSPRIRRYLELLERVASEKTMLTLEAIDQKLAAIAMVDLVSAIEIGEPYVDNNGVYHTPISLKDISELTADQRAAIVGIKPKDGGVEVKFADKLKALDMLIKRRGGYREVTDLNVSGNVQVVTMIGDNGRGPLPKTTMLEKK